MINQEQLKELQNRISSIGEYLKIDEKKVKLAEEELKTQDPDFWNDPPKAQAIIKELQELKDEAEGKGKYDKNDAVFTVEASPNPLPVIISPV